MIVLIMNANKRPLSVTIIAAVYIVMGVVGFVYHLADFHASGAFFDGVFSGVVVELIRLLALVAGMFILRGQNWARWLALVWIAVHAVISAFHSIPEFAIHCLFTVVIGWVLFRPAAARYFRR